MVSCIRTQGGVHKLPYQAHMTVCISDLQMIGIPSSLCCGLQLTKARWRHTNSIRTQSPPAAPPPPPPPPPFLAPRICSVCQHVHENRICSVCQHVHESCCCPDFKAVEGVAAGCSCLHQCRSLVQKVKLCQHVYTEWCFSALTAAQLEVLQLLAHKCISHNDSRSI